MSTTTLILQIIAKKMLIDIKKHLNSNLFESILNIKALHKYSP